MDANAFINVLLGAIAGMAGFIAWIYRSDREDKKALIERLLSSAEKQAEQQREQLDISRETIRKLQSERDLK